MTIEEFLEQWKNNSLFGERQFKKLNVSLVPEQVLYLLNYKANVSVDLVKNIIEKSKFFQTRVHGLTEKDGVNLDGGNYVCKQILNQLEANFLKTISTSFTGKQEE